ncbi:MAG: hypothetical protein VKO64_04045 [Candidatus Sericytochromatia bacterium]|nr:hypothetical protein [Candidatus Sericytochromatia bacterium]
MLPLTHVLHQTNQAFRKAPWLPAPFLVSSMALRLVTDGAAAPEPMLLTAAMLLHLALTAGFMGSAYHLANASEQPETGKAVEDAAPPPAKANGADDDSGSPETPGEAFLVGVGRHFTGMAVGHGMLLLGALVLVGGVVRTVSARFPLPSEVLLEGVRNRLRSNQMPLPEQLEALLPWAWCMTGLALVFLLATLFLTAWKQAMVADRLGIFRSFGHSAEFVRRNPGVVLGILTIEGLGDLLMLPLLFVPEPFLRALADVGIVTMHAWASLALMVAWTQRRAG